MSKPASATDGIKGDILREGVLSPKSLPSGTDPNGSEGGGVNWALSMLVTGVSRATVYSPVTGLSRCSNADCQYRIIVAIPT